MAEILVSFFADDHDVALFATHMYDVPELYEPIRITMVIAKKLVEKVYTIEEREWSFSVVDGHVVQVACRLYLQEKT